MKTPPFRAIHIKAAHGPSGSWLATPVTVTAVDGDTALIRADIGWGFYDGPADLADLATTPREAGEILSRKLNFSRVRAEVQIDAAENLSRASAEKSASLEKAGAAAR